MSTQHAVGYLLRVACGSLPDAERERVADQLWSCGATAIEERENEMLAGFSDEGSALVAMALIGDSAALTAVTDDAYLSEYRRYLRPISIGGISIRAPWLPPSRVGLEIVIDPRRSFGSGAHASTALAIELMQTVDLTGAAVVDLGSGSGILSVVAAKLGAKKVFAVDSDPEALLATQLNSVRNGVPHIVEIASEVPTNIAFDVVAANVLLPVHRELASTIGAARVVVASGVLESQRCDLLRCYNSHSNAIECSADGWYAVRLES